MKIDLIKLQESELNFYSFEISVHKFVYPCIRRKLGLPTILAIRNSHERVNLFIRGRSWSFVVILGHSWAFLVICDRS